MAIAIKKSAYLKREVANCGKSANSQGESTGFLHIPLI